MSTQSPADALGREPEGRLLWKFYVPAVIGLLVTALYNIVDRIFIGRGVGALALAGLSAAFPVMIISGAFALLVGMGAGNLISIRLGEKEPEKASRILGNAFILLILTSLFVTAGGLLFLDPMLALFGASANSAGYARDYLTIILAGVILQNVGFGLNYAIRAEGNARLAMITMLIGAVINTILDPLFIFGFGWGVAGAAIATIIAQAACTIWVLMHFRRPQAVVRLRLNHMVLKLSLVKEILAIGIAPFIMHLGASAVQALYNRQLLKYSGDAGVGAISIVNSIFMMLAMLLFAVTQAAQPVIGYNHGARLPGRVRRTVRLAMAGATVISLAGFLLVETVPELIVALFQQTGSELAALAVRGLRLMLMGLPLVGFQVVGSQYYLASARAKTAMTLTVLRQWLLLIPGMLLLPLVFGTDGIWLALPLSDVLSATVIGTLMVKEMRRLRMAELATAPAPVLHPAG